MLCSVAAWSLVHVGCDGAQQGAVGAGQPALDPPLADPPPAAEPVPLPDDWGTPITDAMFSGADIQVLAWTADRKRLLVGAPFDDHVGLMATQPGMLWAVDVPSWRAVLISANAHLSTYTHQPRLRLSDSGDTALWLPAIDDWPRDDEGGEAIFEALASAVYQRFDWSSQRSTAVGSTGQPFGDVDFLPGTETAVVSAGRRRFVAAHDRPVIGIDADRHWFDGDALIVRADDRFSRYQAGNVTSVLESSPDDIVNVLDRGLALVGRPTLTVPSTYAWSLTDLRSGSSYPLAELPAQPNSHQGVAKSITQPDRTSGVFMVSRSGGDHTLIAFDLSGEPTTTLIDTEVNRLHLSMSSDGAVLYQKVSVPYVSYAHFGWTRETGATQLSDEACSGFQLAESGDLAVVGETGCGTYVSKQITVFELPSFAPVLSAELAEQRVRFVDAYLLLVDEPGVVVAVEPGGAASTPLAEGVRLGPVTPDGSTAVFTMADFPRDRLLSWKAGDAAATLAYESAGSHIAAAIVSDDAIVAVVADDGVEHTRLVRVPLRQDARER